MSSNVSEADWATLYSLVKFKGAIPAAERLAITKNTLYARIHKIEDAYKVEHIVLRWSPDVVLSKAGDALYRHAELMVNQSRLLRISLHQLGSK